MKVEKEEFPLRNSDRQIINQIIALNEQLFKDHKRVLKSIRFHKPSISSGGTLFIEGYTVEWRHEVNGKIK